MITIYIIYHMPGKLHEGKICKFDKNNAVNKNK